MVFVTLDLHLVLIYMEIVINSLSDAVVSCVQTDTYVVLSYLAKVSSWQWPAGHRCWTTKILYSECVLTEQRSLFKAANNRLLGLQQSKSSTTKIISSSHILLQTICNWIPTPYPHPLTNTHTHTCLHSIRPSIRPPRHGTPIYPNSGDGRSLVEFTYMQGWKVRGVGEGGALTMSLTFCLFCWSF